MEYKDYEYLNSKLYEKGNVDTITNDPVIIAREYAEAGVDVSHYSPSDLVRAHGMYIEYASYTDSERADSEQEAYEDARWEREQAEYEAKREAEYQKMLEEEAYEAERLEELEREREYNLEHGFYSKDAYYGDEENYLHELCNRPHLLYLYMKSKGAYEETVYLPGFKKTVNCEEFYFTNQHLCWKDKKDNTYQYAFVCTIENRLEKDLPFFDYKEYTEFLINTYKANRVCKEYEQLKNMTSAPDDRTYESVARQVFYALKNTVQNFKQTGVMKFNFGKCMNYKLARKLAFEEDPEEVTLKIAEIMNSCLK